MVYEPDLAASSRSLSPLPSVLQHGLTAVSFFGFLSFAFATSLFLLLTYRLVYWRVTGQAQRGYNQFLLLVYNLVLADIQQSLAFVLPIRWLVEGKIDVHTTTCWAQGWFVSTGDLGSAVWIFAIAVHTYFAIIKGYKLPYGRFCLVIILLWTFVYTMAIAGVAAHPDNYYVRAGAWCWVNERYETLRLYLHYLWIFMVMFGVIIIYTIIFLRLRLRAASANPASSASNRRAARYMIIYPLVYVICTLPLAAGRMAAMTGRTIPYAYYCVAGSMITSCGWLDVILYALTRRVLIFSEAPPSIDDLGVDTFAVMQLGKGGIWGTHTVISGGPQNRRSRPHSESMDDLFRQPSTLPGQVKADTVVEVNSHPFPDGYMMNDIRAKMDSANSSAIPETHESSKDGLSLQTHNLNVENS